MRHIYKKLVIAAILLAPFSVAAQTVDVSALIAQVTQLQAQLTAQLAARGASSGGGQCVTITRALSKGISGADVTQLQNFLIAQGMLAAGNNTGYFGNLTEAAVMKWQAAHGIEAVGNVGPKTRAAMAACSGSTGTVISNQCPNVTQPANCSNPVAVQLNGCTVGWQCSVSTLPQQTFTATPLSGPVPLVVQFAGIVTSANAGFCLGNFCSGTLVFGDGETGAVPLPNAQGATVTYAINHVYKTPGNYIANLYQGAAGSGAPVVGNGIAISANGVVVPPTVINNGMVSMSVTPTTGNAPITVTITITNATIPQSLSVEFGDGTFGSVLPAGSVMTATHTYSAAGSYTIKLRRTNYAGETCVSASCPVLASTGLSLGGGSVQSPSLAVTPQTGTAPLAVTVFANAAGTYPGGVIVDYGDNNTEIICIPNSVCTQHSTPHTYAAAGTYTVQLLANTPSGPSVLRTAQVTVITLTDTKLSASPTTGAVPLAVTFTGTGGNNTYANGVKIDYGDGTVEQFCNAAEVCGQKTKTHTYTDGTQYNVSLNAYDASNATSTIGSTVVTGTGGPTKIKVTSPKGVARKGDTVSIAWTISGTIPTGSLSFDLYNSGGTALGTLFSITEFQNGSAQWKVPSLADTGCSPTQPNGLCGVILPPGMYTIKPFLSGAVAQLSTEATFEVQNELIPPTPPVSANTASVTVSVTPTSVETGKAASIKYRVTNAPNGSTVSLSLIKTTGETVGVIESNLSAGANETTYPWTAGKIGSATAATGTYQVVAKVSSPSTSNNGQTSTITSGTGTSTTFTITSPVSTTPGGGTTRPKTEPSCTVLSNALGLGDTDATKNGEVTKLQQFLASDPAWYPEGTVNGTFDDATEKAVQNYQKAKGIRSSGTPETTGYGLVGPATRSSISSVSCNGSGGLTFLATPQSGRAPLSVKFTVGTTQAYSIDFGDNQTVQVAANGTGPSHTYAQKGTYIAKLMIGAAGSAPAATLTVNVTDTTTAPQTCASITHEMGIDDTDQTTGGDVTRLQRFLASNPTWYPDGDVTGYYGAKTLAAVKNYQASKGIDQTGNVGPTTLAAIKCAATQPGPFVASPDNGNPPLTVKFTTDLDVSGNTYRVEFGDNTPAVWLTSSSTTHTYQTAGTYTAKLIKSLGNCVGMTGGDLSVCETGYSQTLHTAEIKVGTGSTAVNITSAATFYQYLYSCILERQGAQAEIDAWINLHTTIRDSYLGFFNSPEYQSKNTTNEKFATQMYKCILLRDPEVTAVPYWNGRLAGGTTRAETLASFLVTPEFVQNQLTQLTTATGMPAGNPPSSGAAAAATASTPVTGSMMCTNNAEQAIMARVTLADGSTKDFEFANTGANQVQYSDFTSKPTSLAGYFAGAGYYSIGGGGGERWVAGKTTITGQTSGSISMTTTHDVANYIEPITPILCTVTWH